ncbi:unnamed protein product [Prunus armeniaca]|uniref:Uncharacterized protein n=1 Tax=Prunus armeniaca TaxID=36596 RepID=A0A6J5XYG0_PRUAR|nr:unnamed protein product [Prunus armeniaca]
MAVGSLPPLDYYLPNGILSNIGNLFSSTVRRKGSKILFGGYDNDDGGHGAGDEMRVVEKMVVGMGMGWMRQ